MPTEDSLARSAPHNPYQESNRDNRIGRGGRNRSRVNTSRSGDDTGTFQSDASPIQPSLPAAPIVASTSGSSGRGISHRGSRGRKRQFQDRRQSDRDGTAHHNVSRPPAQRAFGGHLTSSLENNSYGTSSILTGSLSADAPEFVPGQLVVPRM
ncbi:hypothetical protein E4U54_000197 [Claviceps lovelessii]|nr:hypothetical protein E4U54_000197 [Claviceps lovelessii]